MIRLREKDRSEVVRVINVNPTLNLFFMGDLNAYGFDDDYCKYFGFFEGDKLKTLMLHYSDSFHITGEKITEQECAIIRQYVIDNDIARMNFGSNFTEFKDKLMVDYVDETCQLAVYTPSVEMDTTGVELVTVEDAVEFNDVQSEIFDMKRDIEKVKQNIETKEVIGYLIRENGKIVSVASATAFTDKAAMIVGVGTLDEYRQKGYASKCVKKLCDYLYANGQKGVLFYNNPKAGRIYHRLGFEDQEVYHLFRINLSK